MGTSSSILWVLVTGILCWLMDSPHKGPVMQKATLCHDAIMFIPSRDIFLPWTLKWPYIETCIESSTQYRTINCDLKFILLPQFKKDNRFNEHAHPFKLILPWINNCGACYFEKKIRTLENQRKVLNKSLMHSLKKNVWEIYISMASYKIAVTPLITQCSYCSY